MRQLGCVVLYNRLETVHPTTVGSKTNIKRLQFARLQFARLDDQKQYSASAVMRPCNNQHISQATDFEVNSMKDW